MANIEDQNLDEICYNLYREISILRSKIVILQIPNEFRNVLKSDEKNIYNFNYLKSPEKCEREISARRDLELRQNCQNHVSEILDVFGNFIQINHRICEAIIQDMVKNVKKV